MSEEVRSIGDRNRDAGGVRLSGRLQCTSPSEVDAVKAHLQDHVRLTRAEPGCMSFDIWQADDPMVWNVEERFLDRAAFEHHQERTRASAWWAATSEIPRAYRIDGLE